MSFYLQVKYVGRLFANLVTDLFPHPAMLCCSINLTVQEEAGPEVPLDRNLVEQHILEYLNHVDAWIDQGILKENIVR